MVNTLKLEIAILKSGRKKKEIAQLMGISTSALSRKINNVSDFKASEIHLIANELNIQNGTDIFFAS